MSSKRIHKLDIEKLLNIIGTSLHIHDFTDGGDNHGLREALRRQIKEATFCPCQSCEIQGVLPRPAVTTCLECEMDLCHEHAKQHFTGGGATKIHCEKLTVANDVIEMMVKQMEDEKPRCIERAYHYALGFNTANDREHAKEAAILWSHANWESFKDPEVLHIPE